MKLLKQIPNIITLSNLGLGCVAVFYASNNDLLLAAYLSIAGIFLDFFDGFFARILKVSGEFGKQLDSLADMVTSGVVPGIILFQLFRKQEVVEYIDAYIPYLGIIFILGAACRLAKFNIDERQSDSFIGLPTPAATIFVLSIPLMLSLESSPLIHAILGNFWFLLATTVTLTYLMNAELPLFSLKFKGDISWKKNHVKYVFLVISIVLFGLLKVIAIQIVITLYVMLSIIFRAKKIA
jgi:CDP-diacylglycerol--serine O-phosphatidyltransferase